MALVSPYSRETNITNATSYVYLNIPPLYGEESVPDRNIINHWGINMTH